MAARTKMKCTLGDTWMLPFQTMEFFESQWYHSTGAIKTTGAKYQISNSTQLCNTCNVLFNNFYLSLKYTDPFMMIKTFFSIFLQGKCCVFFFFFKKKCYHFLRSLNFILRKISTSSPYINNYTLYRSFDT